MLDHLIDPIKTPADALSNALIFATVQSTTKEQQAAWIGVANTIAAFVPDETIAQIKLSIEELWTETTDYAGE